MQYLPQYNSQNTINTILKLSQVIKEQSCKERTCEGCKDVLTTSHVSKYENPMRIKLEHAR